MSVRLTRSRRSCKSYSVLPTPEHVGPISVTADLGLNSLRSQMLRDGLQPLARPMLSRPRKAAESRSQWEGTVRALVWLATALLVTVISVPSASARVVRMETVVALTDRSDPSIKQALMEAFDTSLRGAVAMGFARIRVDEARVLQDVVVLATTATDEDDEDKTFDHESDE